MSTSTGHEPTYTWTQLQKQIELSVKAERAANVQIIDVLAEDYGRAGLPMAYQALKACSKEIAKRGEA